MKTGICSLLFAINFFYDFGALLPVNALLGGSIINPPSTDTAEVLPSTKPPPSTDPLPSSNSLPTNRLPEHQAKCLTTTLSGSSELLIRIGMLISIYDEGMRATLNDDFYETSFKEIKDCLNSTLCFLDDVLETGDTQEELSIPTSERVKSLIESLRPIMDQAGLSKPHMKTLHSLLLPALTPSCLPALLAQDLGKIISDLQLQACQGQNEQVFYEDVAASMQRLGCLLRCPGDLLRLQLAMEAEAISTTFPPALSAEPETTIAPLLSNPAVEPETTSTQLSSTPSIEPETTLTSSPALVKRDLGIVFPPEGPLVLIACTEVDLLMKSVTHV